MRLLVVTMYDQQHTGLVVNAWQVDLGGIWRWNIIVGISVVASGVVELRSQPVVYP